MIKQEPILVTGTARSGAGIIAGIFVKGSAFGGIMTNSRGMYENDQIRETIVKPYLQTIKTDPSGQYPLPELSKLSIPYNWRSQVEAIIQNQGYSSGPWMYKDSRIGLMWPIWHYAFPNAKWVLVRRRTGDIIESCTKTAYMNMFKDASIRQVVGVENEEAGWLWWIHEYEKRWVEMMNEGVNVRVLWPERMVYGDYSQLFEILDWLGLHWSSEIINFVDSSLWTSRKKEGRV
jgi:hypothetical protein